MDGFAEKSLDRLALPVAAPARRPSVRDTSRTWSLSSLAGCLTEVSDSGAAPTLTAAAALILQAQQRGEPAAWVCFGNSIFFPPDFVGWGIDLEALPVIRVPDALAASRAADQLLRSGAFGLVVLDLKTQVQMHMAVQSRLAALARRHHAALICITRKKKGAPSLGPLVSLHGEGRISRTAFSRFDWRSASSRTNGVLRDGATRSRAMERMACVDIAAFPLQLLLRDHPEWKDHPAAVVDRDKAQGTILWVNHRARVLRILPGMRHGAGLALSRHLRAGIISRTVVEKAVTALVPRLRRFAAEVEPSRDQPGVFWLGASGLSLLHPCLEEWAGLIHDDLVATGLHNTVAVGFSRFGSHAAARACDRTVVFRTPEEEHEHVRGVPLDRLDLAPEVRDILARLAIHTLGGFLDLPASQVRSRLGREAHRLHRLAAGDLLSPFHPEIPSEPTTAGTLLDYPETDHRRLTVLVEALLESLLDSLDQRHEVMTSLLLHLRLDDRSERTETLRPARPTLDRAQILDLLRLRMEATALPAGVTEIIMEVRGACPDIRQGELFHDVSARDHDAANRALARLRARFGDAALLRARPRPGHLPEARFTWEPMEAVPPPRPRRVRLRPLVRRFFPKPVRLTSDAGPRVPGLKCVDPQVAETRTEDSFFTRESSGPCIISGGWWGSGAEVHREYHFVRAGEGPWLWIYYDRKRRDWFLHGKVE